MRVTIKQNELLELVKDYLNDKVDIESVMIEVKTNNMFNDYITFSKNSYDIGSFVKDDLMKGEK